MTAPPELTTDGAWYLSSVELQRSVGGSLTTNLPKYRRAIAASTDQIDKWTGRRFLQDASASARWRAALDCQEVCVGDFDDPADVIVETDDVGDGTWSAWGQDEWRPGADDKGLGRSVRVGDEQWRWIIAAGTRRFPTSGTYDRVRVITKWGWLVTPQPVIEACLHLSGMHFQNKDRAEQIMAVDPEKMAKGLVCGYAVEGGELFYQPLVG